MTPFLAAQAVDPFDPAPMLIQADWLEECGDLVGAAVLRGLAEAGVPSVAALAWEVVLISAPRRADRFRAGMPGRGSGVGDGLACRNRADEFGNGFGDRHGDGIDFGFGEGFADDHDERGRPVEKPA